MKSKINVHSKINLLENFVKQKPLISEVWCYFCYQLGTTTTGNLCRRMFKEPKHLAAVLGIPVEMVQNYATILAVINEKTASINADAFEAYCNAYLDKLYYGEFKMYSWRSLTPTVR